jgi:biotin-dependent carboxylase-like uncharacterized protein
MTRVEVVAPGALTTIQDLGRPGWAHIGVPRSGAADRPALALANRLVGNEQGAAALETTLTGPTLRFDGPAVVALTGAPVQARIGGRVAAMHHATAVAAGEELRIGNARAGMRTYIAFKGGIDVPLVLGSAATDVLTGLGPAPLAGGHTFKLGAPSTASRTDPAAPRPAANAPEEVTLHTVLGPRADWFSERARERLTSEPFTVTPRCNRIGLRLEGPGLDRARCDELPSEGLVAGAIQVPLSGQPILLLADHPTTGGYPVIAVVSSADLPLAAQLRPGQQLRFASGGLS